MYNKVRHFYFNKYLVTPFSSRKYFISYDFRHRVLWFRVFKVATRTVDHFFRENCLPGEYIYSSSVGYMPGMYRHYFKFAFVRNPVDRFLSAFKDKVLSQNYFRFSGADYESMKSIDNFIAWVKKLDIEQCDEHLRAQYASIDTNHVDFIGRFENFNEDLEYVARKIGLTLNENMHLNKSIASAVSLTDESKKEICGIYRKDIRIFYPELIGMLQ